MAINILHFLHINYFVTGKIHVCFDMSEYLSLSLCIREMDRDQSPPLCVFMQVSVFL